MEVETEIGDSRLETGDGYEEEEEGVALSRSVVGAVGWCSRVVEESGVAVLMLLLLLGGGGALLLLLAASALLVVVEIGAILVLTSYVGLLQVKVPKR